MTSAFVRPEATATITVTEPILVTPAYTETVYSYGFEDYSATDYPQTVTYSNAFEPGNTEGWYPEPGSTLSDRGVEYVNIYRASYNDGLPASASIEARGLTVGASYTVSGDVNYWAEADAGTVQFIVEGVGSSMPTTTTPAPSPHLYTFTATATTHTITVTATGNPADIEVSDFAISAWTPDLGVDPDEWGFSGFSFAYGRTGMGAAYTGQGTSGGTILRYNQPWTVGVSHTVSVWVRRYVGSGEVGLYEGSGPPSMVNLDTTWKKVSFTFTPTSEASNVNFTYVDGGAFYFDDFQVVRSAYTDVHNNGMDGWSNGSVVSTQKRSGTYSLYANAPAKAFTGLVVGHQYTLRGWYLNGSTWTQWSETFTAVSTAQSKTLNLTGLRQWDDVELIHHIPAVYTNTPSLPISQGKVRLDENYSPYVTASFQVPLTSLDLLEQIDPRDPQRVTVTTTEGVSGDTRTYNLGLRSRTVDHKNGTIDIELASDEILLHDRKRVATTVDSTPRQYETSLRALCNWALGKIGASLAAGTADASIPAAWDAENLIPDPRLMSEPPITTYANLGHSAWDTVFPGPQNGVAHRGIHVASPSNSDSYVNVGPTSGMAFSVQAGKTYVFSATGSVRSVIGGTGPSEPDQAYGTVMPRQRALVVHATGPGFSPAYKVWHSPQVANVAQTGASAGYRVSVKFTVPRGTTDVFLRAYHGGTSGSITWSQFQLVEAGPGTTAEDAAYFWGSKPADGKYAYKWRDLPDKSPSERTAIQERSPALFDWTPGQSLFDFLQPLINAAGLRLFCDENRVWRLVDPAEYEVPGFIVAQTGHNAIEGTDAITRNDDTWADAVVVKYIWTDADGVSHSAYDSAGPDDGKTITREVEREYTGPGAAASILASFEGRGRTQSVTVVGQYLATPGMDVSVNLPGTLTQVGKVRAVELDLGSGINRIETRGLIDAYPGSWILWNPTQTWSQVNNTLKWKDA